MNEMALILERATARGVRRGLDDKCDDVYNECPLSGEWAGESVEELLGDLICQGESIYKQANGIGDDDPMYWSDVADMGTITDEICEAYLAGYNSVFSND